jgi:hypothetical protein
MTKKEWQQQADAYFQKIMKLLENYEEVAYIGQEPYKGDFFKVFAEAYRSGHCTFRYRSDFEKDRLVPCKAQPPFIISGEKIWSVAKSQGWVHANMTQEEKRYRDIKMLMTWWDEWVYAWKHPVPRRKYVRQRPDRGCGTNRRT